MITVDDWHSDNAPHHTDDDYSPSLNGHRDLTDEEIDALLEELDPRVVDKPAPVHHDDGELHADPELDAFLREPEPDYDWLIPQVLERGDRMILTGAEGAGKSTLLRQIAVQCASGVHPFTNQPIDPVNTLLVDLENTRRQTKRQLRPLRHAAGDEYPNGHLNIVVRTAGLNLTDPTDMVWLDERVRANNPDVLIIGPIYKMHTGDPIEEGPARTVIAALDLLRENHGIALLIEAHSPHATNGGARPTRPYGASIWMRWPEFGLHITESGQLKHWRGDRDERQWPTALRRGGEWPWSPVIGTSDQTFASILAVVEDHGAPMSYHEIGVAMSCSKQWVGKTIKANKRQWDALKERIGGEWP